MKLSDNCKDKIKGLIFGQAIGDALGLGTEFLTKQAIGTLYPNGYDHYSQMVQDKHRKRWKIGAWTDDTEQFLCIMDSLIAHQNLDELDIARRFKHWFDTNGVGIGMHTYRVLTVPEYELYPRKTSELIWKLKGKVNASNGGLMRNSIICSYQFWDLDTVLYNCERICQLTHFSPICVDTCKIMAHIIHAELMEDGLSWQKLQNLMQDYDPQISDYIYSHLDVDVNLLNLDDAQTLGYTAKALTAGIWAYYYADDFKQGLLSIIMQGGDADTNGCIAGSILGAKFGFHNIPKIWIDDLLDKDLLENKVQAYFKVLENLC